MVAGGWGPVVVRRTAAAAASLNIASLAVAHVARGGGGQVTAFGPCTACVLLRSRLLSTHAQPRQKAPSGKPGTPTHPRAGDRPRLRWTAAAPQRHWLSMSRNTGASETALEGLSSIEAREDPTTEERGGAVREQPDRQPQHPSVGVRTTNLQHSPPLAAYEGHQTEQRHQHQQQQQQGRREGQGERTPVWPALLEATAAFKKERRNLRRSLRTHVQEGRLAEAILETQRIIACYQEYRTRVRDMESTRDTEGTQARQVRPLIAVGSRQQPLEMPLLCDVLEAMTLMMEPDHVLVLANQLRALGQRFPRHSCAIFLEAIVRREHGLMGPGTATARARKNAARCTLNSTHAFVSGSTTQASAAAAGASTIVAAYTTENGTAEAQATTTAPAPSRGVAHTGQPQPCLCLQLPVGGNKHAEVELTPRPNRSRLQAKETVGYMLRFRRVVNSTLDRRLVDEVSLRLRQRAAPAAVTRDVLALLADTLARSGQRLSRQALQRYVEEVRRAGDADEVHAALDMAQRAGYRLNQRQYALLLQLASACRQQELVEHLFQDMQDKGLEPAPWAWAERMRCYALLGDVQAVEGLISQMKHKELPLLPAVFHRYLEAHTQAGDLTGAEQVYKIYKRTGNKVHPSLMLPLLRAYLQENRPQSALTALMRMRAEGLTIRLSDLDVVGQMLQEQGSLAGVMRLKLFRNELPQSAIARE